MGKHALPEGAATQSKYPWRAVLRTLVAFVIAIVPYVSTLIADLSTQTQNGALLAAAPIVAAVTRLLAAPAVDALLKRWLPPLAAEPRG